MEALSLTELKKQNQQEEAAEKPEVKPEVVEEEVKQELAEEVSRETTEEQDEVEDVKAEEGEEKPAESEQKPEENAENLEFMKSDEEEKPGFKPNPDAAAYRKKYRKQAKEAEAEAERLRLEKEKLERELEEARKAQALAASVNNAARPKRENFNSEEEYEDALYDFRTRQDLNKTRELLQKEQKQREFQAKQEKVNRLVDEHYVRVHELAEKSNIPPETYQRADEKIRLAVDGILPGAGDSIVDVLIAKMGAGSEKVMYNLAVNSSRYNKFIGLLRDDPTGLDASLFLGELKATLNAPASRTTKAPDPIPNISGDRKDKTPQGSARSLKEQYDKAHASGNASAAFKAKRQAKAAGIDTSGWVN